MVVYKVRRRRRRKEIGARTDLFGQVKRREIPSVGEHEFQRTVVLPYLRAALPADAVVIHVPNGGMDPKWRGIAASLGAKDGAPDLIIFWNERGYCLELKSKSGERSEAQIEMHAALVKTNIPIATIRTVETLEMYLKQWGLPLRGALSA